MTCTRCGKDREIVLKLKRTTHSSDIEEELRLLNNVEERLCRPCAESHIADVKWSSVIRSMPYGENHEGPRVIWR